MPKIMEIIEKETKGKSYHTYKYSYDSIMLLDIPQMSLPQVNPLFSEMVENYYGAYNKFFNLLLSK